MNNPASDQIVTKSFSLKGLMPCHFNFHTNFLSGCTLHGDPLKRPQRRSAWFVGLSQREERIHENFWQSFFKQLLLSNPRALKDSLSSALLMSEVAIHIQSQWRMQHEQLCDFTLVQISEWKSTHKISHLAHYLKMLLSVCRTFQDQFASIANNSTMQGCV